MRISKNVKVLTENDSEIEQIEFPPAEDGLSGSFFLIRWKDGKVTKYRYSYVQRVIQMQKQIKIIKKENLTKKQKQIIKDFDNEDIDNIETGVEL